MEAVIMIIRIYVQILFKINLTLLINLIVKTAVLNKLNYNKTKRKISQLNLV